MKKKAVDTLALVDNLDKRVRHAHERINAVEDELAKLQAWVNEHDDKVDHVVWHGPAPAPLQHTAYLLAHLDLQSLKIDAVRVFSEPTPTMLLQQERWLLIKSYDARTYQEAQEALLKSVDGNGFDAWVLPLLGRWQESDTNVAVAPIPSSSAALCCANHDCRAPIPSGGTYFDKGGVIKCLHCGLVEAAVSPGGVKKQAP